MSRGEGEYSSEGGYGAVVVCVVVSRGACRERAEEGAVLVATPCAFRATRMRCGGAKVEQRRTGSVG